MKDFLCADTPLPLVLRCLRKSPNDLDLLFKKPIPVWSGAKALEAHKHPDQKELLSARATNST